VEENKRKKLPFGDEKKTKEEKNSPSGTAIF
jgi:hypothetical protein